MHIIEKWVLLFYWEKNEKKKKWKPKNVKSPSSQGGHLLDWAF